MTPLVKAQYKNQYAIQFMNSQNKQLNKSTRQQETFLILTETEANLFSQMQKQVPQQMGTCVIFNVSQDVNLQ